MAENFYPLYPYGKLDIQSEAILRQIAESNEEPLSNLTPQQARETFFEKSWLGITDEKVIITNFHVEDSGIEIPLRVYTPHGKERYPVLLFFHGGGFVVGALDEFDALCTYMAEGAGCIVVSVGYRLAPENKYPAALHDALVALEWVGNNASNIKGDASRIAVAGDSAGANLAAVTSLIARDKALPKLLCQVLICPWVDLLSTDRDSYKYFGEGLWLSTANIYWYRNHYLNNIEEAKSYMVSPMQAENLSGLPPAIIIAAEYDVLRDEAKLYAERLAATSVPVKYSEYKGMLHDFVTLPGLFDRATEAINEINETLKFYFND